MKKNLKIKSNTVTVLSPPNALLTKQTYLIRDMTTEHDVNLTNCTEYP